MVPNVVESVYGITTKVEVTTTTIGVNRSSPKAEKEYFCKIKFNQQLAFKKFWVVHSKSEMITKSQATSKFKNPCQKAVWVPRHPLVPGYKNLSSRTFWVVQLIPIYFVGLGRTEKIII